MIKFFILYWVFYVKHEFDEIFFIYGILCERGMHSFAYSIVYWLKVATSWICGTLKMYCDIIALLTAKLITYL